MAQVAAVYVVKPVPRSTAEVLSSHDEGPKEAPKATHKWLTASVSKEAAEVIADAFAEAERRDPDHLRPWVALVDGNNHQIDRIEAEAKKRKLDVTIVVDLIHVLEYLWDAAWCFFAEADPAAEAWVGDKALAVLEGKAGLVAAAIKRKATNRDLDAKARKNADTCASYLKAKARYLDYPKALANGWPSPPESSRERFATWSKTGWTSPAHGGGSKAPRPSSNYEHSARTMNGGATGPSISTRNESGCTNLATSTMSPPGHLKVTPAELHPFGSSRGVRRRGGTGASSRSVTKDHAAVPVRTPQRPAVLRKQCQRGESNPLPVDGQSIGPHRRRPGWRSRECPRPPFMNLRRQQVVPTPAGDPDRVPPGCQRTQLGPAVVPKCARNAVAKLYVLASPRTLDVGVDQWTGRRRATY